MEGITKLFARNQIDVLALNEIFLKPKFKFHLPYTKMTDFSRHQRKNEWKNEHFNVITDNEALAIENELQNKIRLFWLPFIAQMEILVQGYLG